MRLRGCWLVAAASIKILDFGDHACTIVWIHPRGPGTLAPLYILMTVLCFYPTRLVQLVSFLISKCLLPLRRCGLVASNLTGHGFEASTSLSLCSRHLWSQLCRQEHSGDQTHQGHLWPQLFPHCREEAGSLLFEPQCLQSHCHFPRLVLSFHWKRGLADRPDRAHRQFGSCTVFERAPRRAVRPEKPLCYS